jgi:hypothetical protein
LNFLKSLKEAGIHQEEFSSLEEALPVINYFDFV